jgi:hypothetical protein
MILCTHAVVGAALASLAPSHPAAGFMIGFASHFALDAIPHWDYPINSPSVNPKIGAPLVFDGALLRDMVFIGSDGLVGIIAAVLLFGLSADLWAIVVGAIGAMLPDPLQFLYVRLPFEPLRTLQRFHCWAHSEQQIKGLVVGFGVQVVFIIVVAGLTIAIHRGVF